MFLFLEILNVELGEFLVLKHANAFNWIFSHWHCKVIFIDLCILAWNRYHPITMLNKLWKCWFLQKLSNRVPSKFGFKLFALNLCKLLVKSLLPNWHAKPIFITLVWKILVLDWPNWMAMIDFKVKYKNDLKLDFEILSLFLKY